MLRVTTVLTHNYTVVYSNIGNVCINDGIVYNGHVTVI